MLQDHGIVMAVAQLEVLVLFTLRGGVVGDVVIRAASDKCHLAWAEVDR